MLTLEEGKKDAADPSVAAAAGLFLETGCLCANPWALKPPDR